MEDDILPLVRARRGHFRFESGHHAELWLDLEALCLHPAAVRPFARRLAERLRPHAADVVCGPLVEGAFVALFVAEALGLPFTYSMPQVDVAPQGLFPVSYRVPLVLRPELRGRRVAIVNDVVSAGSAVRGTHRDLVALGAIPVAIGALLVLGDSASAFAGENGLALEATASMPSRMWTPNECPLCAARVPLDACEAE